MSRRDVTLLAIDDDPESLALIEAALEQDGLRIVTSLDPEEGLQAVRRVRPEIVLLDLRMPKMSGMEVLEQILTIDPGAEVILVTADESTDSAVIAIQKGACDYLTKPLAIERLQERVNGLIEQARARFRAESLDRELLDAYRFGDMIGRSPLMREVFAKIARIAPHFRTALIQGPTGTGKELVARALHRMSPQASGPLVVCNCAALTESLVESELFGHVRGAFTGAVQDRSGLFEAANGGTLFLDEVGDMPLAAQAKLLRAVQEQEIQRIGSTAVRKINLRVVAATNRDLREAVQNNTFRRDLYYRLSMVEIRLPRLADRKEDLPLLTRHFVDYWATQYKKPVSGLTRRAETLLARYHWPGNVRELENALGHACMMTETATIDVQDLPDHLLQSLPDAGAGGYPLISLEAAERLHVQRVLDELGGDKVRAANILGVSRATLYRLLSREATAKFPAADPSQA
jgi:DNA-binding NtrC family response regulator